MWSSKRRVWTISITSPIYPDVRPRYQYLVGVATPDEIQFKSSGVGLVVVSMAASYSTGPVYIPGAN